MVKRLPAAGCSASLCDASMASAMTASRTELDGADHFHRSMVERADCKTCQMQSKLGDTSGAQDADV